MAYLSNRNFEAADKFMTYRLLQILNREFNAYFGIIIILSKYVSVALVVISNALLISKKIPHSVRAMACIITCIGILMVGYMFPLYANINTNSKILLTHWKQQTHRNSLLPNSTESKNFPRKIVRSLPKLGIRAGNVYTFYRGGILRQISSVIYQSIRLCIVLH